LQELAQSLSALADRMEPKEAATAAAQAAATLTQAIKDNKNPDALSALVLGLSALADRMEPKEAATAAAQAAATRFITRAWQIFEFQAWFLGGQGYWADWRAAGQAVLAAAQAVGDHATLGWTHMLIGRYSTFTGSDDEDRAHLVQALDHFQRAGDLPGQAWTRLFTGLACTWTGDWAEAVTHGQQALSLFRQAGNRAGEGLALAGLGFGHAHLGNYDLARGYARRAQEFGQESGDPMRLAIAWHTLGLVHSRLGEQDQAISCYQQALALVGDWTTPVTRRLVATVLTDLGNACQAAADPPGAARAWQQALQILDDLRLPDSLGVHAKLGQVSSPARRG